MQGGLKQNITKELFSGLYREYRASIMAGDYPALTAQRENAIRRFEESGFPTTKLESWKNTDLKESFAREYNVVLKPEQGVDAQKVFRCNIPHLDTAIMGQLNGWYVSKDVPLMELGNGIIMGSLAEAIKKYPALVEAHLGKYTSSRTDSNTNFNADSFTDLNTAYFQDGVFIYVPDNVKSPKPVQIINVIHHDENLFLQSRNLIVLGKNSRLSLVHCDDSYNHQPSFSNVVTEIYLGENSSLDHYKLQNLNNTSTLISTVYFQMEAFSNLKSHYISLNGGLLRNNIRLRFNGPQGNANIYGIYLMDSKQHIDNQVFIDHAFPDCTSGELFKGILDEHSSGVFNGHVLVERNAVRTNAYQSNRNILLTETAKVNSKPFLEIYNDDVKCSHGSTTGQLDQDAMYYLRQRGIGEDSARMLLMYAYADEVISKIDIEPLKYRIEDMVKKRLQGELQICEACVLHCSTPEHPMEFVIDMTKI
ncbi:MAG: Fe-S cluster assembly protein SufD [Bacteroidetes bacterium]|nr:Fe-S cluster assembly protein SufD [Bacteroidota bacterium]